MKRTVCFIIAIIMMMTTMPAFADNVPTTTSERNEWAAFKQRSKEYPSPVRPPVAAIQDIIRGKYSGIRDEVTVIDGKFGPATKRGVKIYQEMIDVLQVDGIVGKFTWRSMCEGLVKYHTETSTMATTRFYRLDPDEFPYTLSGTITRVNGSGFQYWYYDGTSVDGKIK